MPQSAKVLVVEDNSTFATSYRIALEAMKLEPVLVPDRASALRALSDDAFELLFTDCYLPALEGPALVEEARRLDPEIPAVCVSVEITRRLRRMCREAGADLVVTKPDIPLFEYVVRGHLRSSRVAGGRVDSQGFRALEEMIAGLTRRPREPLVHSIMGTASRLGLDRLHAAAGAALCVIGPHNRHRTDLEEICDWLLFELDRIWNEGLARAQYTT